MRRAMALVALLLMASFVPSGEAAEAPLLTDPVGDVDGGTAGAAPVILPTKMPRGATDRIDLVSLAVEETREQLTFHIGYAAHQRGFGMQGVSFRWNAATYVASVWFYMNIAGMDGAYASLYAVEADGSWTYVDDIEHASDSAAAVTTLIVPLVRILDEKQRVPLKGDELQELYVFGELEVGLNTDGTTAQGVTLRDRMPDTGGVSLPLLKGDEAAGHLRLSAPVSVRVSNGGATTFVFNVLAHNSGKVDDSVSFTTDSLPDGWKVRVDSPLPITAAQSRAFPVLVSVPFAHDHGGFNEVVLRATSGVDASAFATIRLGVIHTPIPMPAGHHPDVYLHTTAGNAGGGPLFEFNRGFINADPDHTNDAAEAQLNSYGSELGWELDLEPSLQTGLDFDIKRVGKLVGSIMGRSSRNVDISVELVLVDEDGNEVLLADAPPTGVAFDAQQATPFEFALEPTSESDYIPWEPGRTLRLRILLARDDSMFICCLTATSPTLLTADFKLTLPLDEYHDRIERRTDTGSGALAISAEGILEKAGKPGALLTYGFNVTNLGKEPESIVLAIAGADAGLGTLAPNGEVRIGPGESRRVTLGVRIPSDANEGQRFEVLLFARAQSDPSVSAIGRTATTVAFDGTAVADESELFAAAAAESKDTPGAGVLLTLLAGAVAVAFARRSRR